MRIHKQNLWQSSNQSAVSIFGVTMQIWHMSLLVFSAGLFNTIPSGSSNVIPTKEEQANLLTNVQEVFEQVKVLANIEGNSTDESVVDDINRMIGRAKDKLLLVEELALTKMTCNSNSVCMLDSKVVIKELAKEGIDTLSMCVEQGSDDISLNSAQLTNSTGAAVSRGQQFLDTLYDCSRKNGLHVVSCYKNVIATDVIPVKLMLLGAIEAHKFSHLRAIQIRKDANDCVDSVLERYQAKIEKALNEALNCK